MPELPSVMADRFQRDYGLPAHDASMMTQSKGFAAFFETAAKACGQPKLAANWLMGEVSKRLNADGATIELVLAENGTTTGRLFIPAGVAGVPDFDENLAGTWAVVDGRVVLSHAADTFLRDMPLELEGDRLVGDQRFGGVRVRVVLQRG
mgnify:CR=1 FL=1